jgi:SAM-dependent methyltransferase
MSSPPEYVLGSSEEEVARLDVQAAAIAPATALLLQAGGIAPGMRVLDLGTGAGSVALLAARTVGPTGTVVTVDRDPDALALAASHIEREGVRNVEFVEGDLGVPELPGGYFDAVVSRLLLMYLPDPAATLHAAARRLRPGGVVCCHEMSMNPHMAMPEPPLVARVHRAVATTFRRAGAELHLGLRLHRLMADAGLPAPELHGETLVACGPEAPMWAWANVARGLLPLMERLGVEGADEIRAPDLDERMLAELCAHDAVMVAPMLVGAWTRVPGR